MDHLEDPKSYWLSRCNEMKSECETLQAETVRTFRAVNRLDMDRYEVKFSSNLRWALFSKLHHYHDHGRRKKIKRWLSSCSATSLDSLLSVRSVLLSESLEKTSSLRFLSTERVVMIPESHELTTDHWSTQGSVVWSLHEPATLFYRNTHVVLPSRGVGEIDHSVWMKHLSDALLPQLAYIDGLVWFIFQYFDD